MTKNKLILFYFTFLGIPAYAVDITTTEKSYYASRKLHGHFKKIIPFSFQNSKGINGGLMVFEQKKNSSLFMKKTVSFNFCTWRVRFDFSYRMWRNYE